MGERPAFLTRGYGRVPPHSAAVEADLSRHGIADVGDEALILAATAPTIVGVDRQVAAGLAVTLGATALILDDGFHSRRLEPDLAILVVDESYGAGSGYCPPAGPLRAPLRAQFARADVTLFIDAPGSTAPALEIPVSLAERWRARLVPDPDAAAHFRGARVLAFAGVGRPEKFELSLQEIGALVVACRWFPDHHLYRPGELKFLALQAKRLDARLVTTEKDAVRLGPGHAMETLPVSLNFNDEEQVAGRLSAALSEARKKRRG
jgi:tetraacyldisaccharide 4'-kinase